jgi:hypothetical protein
LLQQNALVLLLLLLLLLRRWSAWGLLKRRMYGGEISVDR